MVNLKSWAIVIFVLKFARFLSNFITLERNKNKNPGVSPFFNTDVPFVRELLVNTQGNLITPAAEFDVTFDFAIYLGSQKDNRQIERSKNLAIFVFFR